MRELQVHAQCALLFLNLNSSWNKGWERPVPAAAVIPAAQVVVVLIGA